MSSNKIKQYFNLYSIGILPKIQGRYLTNATTVHNNKKYIQHRPSDFSLERAKNRLNVELKRIEVSQRIGKRSQRNKRMVYKTEPNAYHTKPQPQTIHVQSIDLHFPENHDLSPLSRRNSVQVNNCSNISCKLKRMPQHSQRLKIKIMKNNLDVSDKNQQEEEQADEANCSINKWRESKGQTANLFNFQAKDNEDAVLEKVEVGVGRKNKWKWQSRLKR